MVIHTILCYTCNEFLIRAWPTSKTSVKDTFSCHQIALICCTLGAIEEDIGAAEKQIGLKIVSCVESHSLPKKIDRKIHEKLSRCSSIMGTTPILSAKLLHLHPLWKTYRNGHDVDWAVCSLLRYYFISLYLTQC